MKKFLALVTLVCMVLTATAAFAFPSKTAEDLYTVTPGSTSTGVALEHGFAIFLTDPTKEIEEEVVAIYKHVAEAPIATYFDEETQAKLGKSGDLPLHHVDPAALLGYEAVAVACDNYKAEYGDVDADFTFATVFPEGSEVVVMLKTEEWSVQKAVVENGLIKILFTGEELTIMDETPCLMLVLANEIEE